MGKQDDPCSPNSALSVNDMIGSILAECERLKIKLRKNPDIAKYDEMRLQILCSEVKAASKTKKDVSVDRVMEYNNRLCEIGGGVIVPSHRQ